MKADQYTIYVLCQPNGKFWLEGTPPFYTDRIKADDACSLFNRMETQPSAEGTWEVWEFIAVRNQTVASWKESNPLLSEADGGLRERTLRQFARDMNTATELVANDQE